MAATLLKTLVLLFLCQQAVCLEESSDLASAVHGDDECTGDADSCAMNAVQLRGVQTEGDAQNVYTDDLDMPEPQGLVEFDSDPILGVSFDEIQSDADVDLGAGVPPDYLAKRCIGVAYCSFYGYMIVAGDSRAHGMENINHGDVGYYNSLGAAALRSCSGPACVIMTNPVGHRTQDRFHIHYRYYNGGGKSLKHQLEHRVCGKGGWHGFNKCGHASVRFYHGQPGLFSAALDGSHGGLAHTGVTAYPSSCGGSGTIVLLTRYCSIEHSISSR